MSLRATIALVRGSFELSVGLAVEPGETVALLGPNGSGKSTLVEALSGLLPIASGEIVLDQEVLERPAEGIRLRPQERPIGVMFQGLWLFPHLSVRDNVAYGPWARGRRRREARASIEPLLERLDLVALADRRPAELSGGEAQRVALARALAVQPRLLLLDEPLSALDLESRPRTRGLLQRALQEFEGPRVVITHDPLDALLMADQLVVLEDGRVAQSGPSEQVRRQPRTRYVATLAGVNLLEGSLETERGETVLRLGELAFRLSRVDLPPGPEVRATVHPRSVCLARSGPADAPGSWPTRVESLQLEGDRIRVRLDRPEGFCAELPAEEVDLRSFAPGTPVRASVRADDIYVYERH